MPLFKRADNQDITLEFYHKTAIYNSRITGAKVPINIHRVVKIHVRKDHYKTVIISDKGNHYTLEELILPS